MMILKLKQLGIQLKTTLSGTWSEQIFKIRSTNSPMIKLGKHQRTQQQAYRTGDISSTTFNHGGRTIFRKQDKGYLPQVKNYFWHTQTQILFELDEKGYKAVMVLFLLNIVLVEQFKLRLKIIQKLCIIWHLKYFN
ncbi:Hypothetical_protein [Hexamita inflata]|uniref:Hypothetical_protein n=1 Tax=Hexamita inflata TaxID=28002 RepID=A0ABP1GZ75_9EUKA